MSKRKAPKDNVNNAICEFLLGKFECYDSWAMP